MRVKIESFLREVCEKTTKNNEYPVLTSSKSGLFLQSDYFNKQVASTDNTGYKIIKIHTTFSGDKKYSSEWILLHRRLIS